jgi:uncharacterized protein YjiK
MIKKNIRLKNILLLITFFCVYNYSWIDNNSLLKRYDFSSVNTEIIFLSEELEEISGLAYFDIDHLLAHNDEKGRVYKICIRDGNVVEEFLIGTDEFEKDFEGIAVANDSVYMIASNGTLYKFNLNDSFNDIEYEEINTPLSSRNDVEGLCYYEKTHSLLIACKEETEKKHKNYKAVYEFGLGEMKFNKKPRFLISLKKLKQQYDIKNFSPSGIEVNPVNGNIFLISADQEAIIELDCNGGILGAARLDDEKHKQTEGITFSNDGTLILADEKNDVKPKLTFVPLKNSN